jgi:hypothetical protein
MKQSFHNKGGGGIGGGLATEEWEQFYEFDNTKIKNFPVPTQKPLALAEKLDRLGDEFGRLLPASIVTRHVPSRQILDESQQQARDILGRMISIQEELDWECYQLYELIDERVIAQNGTVPPIRVGERAFEIVMARKVEAGQLQTTWFQRHGSTPVTEVPTSWPEEYRKIVERRIAVIETNRSISLVEKPEYKRRWNLELLEERELEAVRSWLLNRMEDSQNWSNLKLLTCARLADDLRFDSEFQKAAQVYRGRADFDLTTLVSELVEVESVPILPVLRYTDSGMRKLALWERSWDLQREEDRIDADVQADNSIPENLKLEVAKRRKADELGEVPIPPKYQSRDFRKSTYWSSRGKLDVPKERFITFPFCERDADSSTVIAWAGWDNLQMAQAIAAYYEQVKNNEGWVPERRMPLLAAIIQLLPGLKQWHNDIHPEYRERMGDFFEQFIHDEARAMEKTLDQILGWAPPVQASRVARRRNS